MFLYSKILLRINSKKTAAEQVQATVFNYMGTVNYK